MNLLKETLDTLSRNNKTDKDIIGVGDGKNFMSWEDFKKEADFDYDSGYGGAEVNESLIIYGKDFWIERREYNGSEWWSFRTTPKIPIEKGKVRLKSSWFYEDDEDYDDEDE